MLTSGWRLWSRLSVLLFVLIGIAGAVKHENFKTCAQSGFCKRNRDLADSIQLDPHWKAPYEIDASTIKFKSGVLTAAVIKTIQPSNDKVKLPLKLTFLQSGSVRVTLDEEKRQKKDIDLRHGSNIRKERYNEAEKWAIVGGLEVSTRASTDVATAQGTTRIIYGPNSNFEAIITHSPLGVEFKRDGVTHVRLNERGLLNMEHWRPKIDKPAPEPSQEGEEPKVDPSVEDESTWWDETFGGNTDTKPRGPESVGLDISFPGYDHVYGIPEHTGPLSLRQTRGGDGQFTEPYRMYNLDVFEYVLDSPMTLYGNIPFMQAHRKDSTVGVFWLNAAETWVDIVKSTETANPLALGIGAKSTTKTHWFSESGLLDLFVFLGPSPKDVVSTYTGLTGYTQLPNQFAIAHHQCRWNYFTDNDVRYVDRKFDRANIPYDVIWLDIEYTDDKKYFTWNPLTFADPVGMQEQLDDSERKLVAIIDPHIKNTDNYKVVEELKTKALAIKNNKGELYKGWCWPGDSFWVDTFGEAALKWWADLFSYAKFPGSRPNLWLWNDMNEPSVFNGPETTAPKDNMHHGDWEHRDVHNIYGMTVVNGTYNGLVARNKEEEKQGGVRPFVLTRSFFSGSQRMGAMWTGDNLADWGHLKQSIPMILSLGISGFPWAGADVGGFFGNPSQELLVRWYQAGAFYPFFRAHAHIDTRRREPYLFPEPERGIVTRALRLRYSLLPAWYTAFHAASTTGSPIVKPMFYTNPDYEAGFNIDDQMFLGETGLLAKPVTSEGTTTTEILLPDSELYVDYFDYSVYKGPGQITVDAPLDKLPLLMRAGHIFPRRDRPRRSSGLMKHDPFTLVMVMSENGDATGTLYHDDGESFSYQAGAYVHRHFTYTGATQTLVSTDLSKPGKKTQQYLDSIKDLRVEKIVIVAAPESWQGKQEVEVAEEHSGSSGPARKVGMRYVQNSSGKANWAVVRDPGVRIGESWSIKF